MQKISKKEKKFKVVSGSRENQSTSNRVLGLLIDKIYPTAGKSAQWQLDRIPPKSVCYYVDCWKRKAGETSWGSMEIADIFKSL